jgi:hypothetical protein
VASALVNTTQQAGSSLGTAMLNTIAASATASFIAAHHTASHLAQEAPVHGYTTGFAISAGLVLAAAVASALLVRAGRPGSETDEATLEEVVPALA